ncbi:hypothetical protein SAZ11_47505 [Streptomyces sp. FXJ1.4098]|nr:hypothetical protein [Streptomyces sp. FXJ1.4098]
MRRADESAGAVVTAPDWTSTIRLDTDNRAAAASWPSASTTRRTLSRA